LLGGSPDLAGKIAAPAEITPGSLDLAGRVAGRIADLAGKIAAPAEITPGSLDLAGKIAGRIAAPAGITPGGSPISPGRSPGGSLLLLATVRSTSRNIQIQIERKIALPYGISPYIPSERITRSRDRSKLRSTCILMNIT